MTAPTNPDAETTPSRAVVVSDACSARLFAALTAYMEDAETKYHNEQCFGDAISAASWRATYLAARDCIRICRKHLSANTERGEG